MRFGSPLRCCAQRWIESPSTRDSWPRRSRAPGATTVESRTAMLAPLRALMWLCLRLWKRQSLLLLRMPAMMRRGIPPRTGAFNAWWQRSGRLYNTARRSSAVVWTTVRYGRAGRQMILLSTGGTTQRCRRGVHACRGMSKTWPRASGTTSLRRGSVRTMRGLLTHRLTRRKQGRRHLAGAARVSLLIAATAPARATLHLAQSQPRVQQASPRTHWPRLSEDVNFLRTQPVHLLLHLQSPNEPAVSAG